MIAFGDAASFKVDRSTAPFMSYVKTSLFKTPQDLCDVVSVLIYCSTDASVLLVVETTCNEYWFPSIKVASGSSWLCQVNKEVVQEIFGCAAQINRLVHVNKIWIPNHKTNYINHAIFEVQVTPDVKKKTRVLNLSKFRGKLRWTTVEELDKFVQGNFLKSPELLDYTFSVKSKPPYVVDVPSEYFTSNYFTETDNTVLVTGKSGIYEQIVDASGIDRAAQELLYKEFLVMTFPALYLGYQGFVKFLLDLGWTKEEIPHLFRSADAFNRGGVSFKELLYFLAAVEPGTTHGGGPAELRCRYIFRYLDNDKNNLLKKDEMRNFVILLRRSKKQPVDTTKVEKDLTDCYYSIGIPDTQALTMSDFLKAVGELKLRGTSQIYRAPHSIQKYIKEIKDRNSRANKLSAVNESSAKPVLSKGDTYEMAAHSIKIQTTGNSINIEHLWNIDNAVSQTCPLTKALSESSRKKSSDQFDQQSKSNELLKSLRYLTQVNKTMHNYGKSDSLTYTWGNLDPAVFAKNLNEVSDEIKGIFVKEQRLLDVSSPVYIMGDLHGNFADLLCFEKILWHVGPGLCPCNLLFLGDYVDRGLFSVEVITYLFAYKLQSPKKVMLLRGNHEIKKVQQQWTFEKECRIKFGEKVGNSVFNAINDAFDSMPLAAVIDGRVFCCHGGIPPPWLCPVATAINDIPPVLSEPQDQSPLAWELMWNDPIKPKFQMTEKVAMELLANEGFAANTRRGTAHIFSVEALEKFLYANGYTHLVRAHEVVEAGFYLQQKGRAVTIFSSSKYCGGQNVAACILADQGKLRVLRLESQ